MTPTSTHTPTATPTRTLTPHPNNCTDTVGYWKNHIEAWPIEDMTIGSVAYTKAEALVILETEPGGDVTYILAHQLIAAKLNILNGADPSMVGTTITDSDSWLSEHPLGSDPLDPDRAQGIALAQTLDNYNSGLIGPGHCGGTITPTPTNTSTPTPTLTVTSASIQSAQILLHSFQLRGFMTSILS